MLWSAATHRLRVLTGLVLALAFALGVAVGPSSVGAAQEVLAFITNDAQHPVPVTGTVSVGNLPATQQVSGSVSISNLPSTQNVAVTGGPVAVRPPVSDVVVDSAGGFHSFAQGATEDLALGANGLNVTAVAVDDGLGEQDTWRAFVVTSTGAVKVATGTGNLFLPLPQPIKASTFSVQCLSANCFWRLEVVGYH
jgi:hypothetical protein